MTGEAKAAVGARRIWAVLLFMCVGYIALFFLLAQQTQTCGPEIAPTSWFLDFDRYLSCRTLNELGDALAGAIAPVAFILLAGAVYIQSQELQAQRQELNETRDVMCKQLDVSTQQVEETRASTKLFEIQTTILQQQHLRREEEIADRNLEADVEALNNHIARHDFNVSVREYMPGSTRMKMHRFSVAEPQPWFPLKEGETLGYVERHLSLLEHENEQENLALASIIMRVQRGVNASRALVAEIEESDQANDDAKSFCRVRGWTLKRPSWQIFIDHMAKMVAMADNLSQAARIRLESTGIHETVLAARGLIAEIDKLERSTNKRRLKRFPGST